jgi:hypothetical protein
MLMKNTKQAGKALQYFIPIQIASASHNDKNIITGTAHLQ